MLLIHGMGLANFQLKNKQEKTQFFSKTFLMADNAIKIVLGMLFLPFNKIETNFANQKFN